MATTAADQSTTARGRMRAGGGGIVPAAVGGLLFGVLTNLAQGWLPGAWNQIANSGAVWSVAAFAAGALPYRRASVLRAAIGGLAAEVGLVVGYYGYAEYGYGRAGMGDLYWPLVWLGMACVAGPLFGAAGHWWRHGRNRARRVTGPAALAGVFGMEGLHYAWTLHYAPQAWAFLICSVLVALLMPRTHKERALTLGAAVAFAFLAYALVELPLGML
ncbi:DUF6518 family protein [Streptomyces minutiscleroticus]|uniref:DUF6518 family protein n=1 Tax=Streptomyces minutiscleroticus TaxID=68238 RepID=UPI003319D1DC